MRRLHLIELGDQEWAPDEARSGGLEILRTSFRLAGLDDDVADLLFELVEKTSEDYLVDLCSGAGGPLPSVMRRVAERGVELQGVLTDKYPDPSSMREASRRSGGRLSIEDDPVDATDVPDDLRGIRTMFNSLHHFRPEMVKSILEDTARAGQPYLSVEFAGRNPRNLLSVAALAPGSALLRPFIRPVRWKRWFYTYLVPLIPSGLLFDGVVSCLRVYSPDHLRELTRDIDGMSWKAGRKETGGIFSGYLSYLMGIPETD